MVQLVLLLVFYLFFPVLLIYLTHKFQVLAKVGPVVLAYLFGLLFGNIGLLPEGSAAWHNLLGHRSFLPAKELNQSISQGLLSGTDLLPNQIARLQDVLMSLIIPLAIPLLLFTLDLRRWLHLAKEALFSLLLGVVSLVLVVVGGFFLFEKYIPEAWKIAGMLIGIYTGGTPNLAAISTALEVQPNLFILTHTYDLMIGSVFLLFLLTSAQPVFNHFLPVFRSAHRPEDIAEQNENGFSAENFDGLLQRESIRQMGAALVLSVFIFGLAGGLSLLVPKSAQLVTVILSITSLGLLFSLNRRVNRLKASFQAGMYLILVFSLLVSSMGDLRVLFSVGFIHLFLYVLLGVLGSMGVHVFLSWLFRVDADTTIITITALTYSPPFVPVVAASLRNKEVIISGLTAGILGYAFGTYLGVGLAYLLQYLG